MGLVVTVDTGEGVVIQIPNGPPITVRIERKKRAKINPDGSISARCKLWIDAPKEYQIRRIDASGWKHITPVEAAKRRRYRHDDVRTT